MTIASALFSSQSEEWGTPQEFFDTLNAEFHFVCDMAATAKNTKCTAFVSREIDALSPRVNWRDFGRVLWCNPPYGKQIGQWFAYARGAAARGATVVMLVPARTDTRWWHEHVQGIADEVRFVKGRLRFVGLNGVKAGAPFPSAVIVYRGRNADAS